jgi:hypothetical protein
MYIVFCHHFLSAHEKHKEADLRLKVKYCDRNPSNYYRQSRWCTNDTDTDARNAVVSSDVLDLVYLISSSRPSIA